MRFRFASLVLCCLLAGCRSTPRPAAATADSVADATGNVPYVDERFHFIFTPPAPLRAALVSDPSLSADRPNPNHLPLFVARDAGSASGIAVSAERVGVATPSDPAAAPDGATFVDRASASIASTPGSEVLRRTHSATPTGWLFDELDYRVAGRYAAIFAFPRDLPEGRFLIVFRADSSSRSALDGITAAIRAARRF